MSTLPLADRRILVTRSAGQAGRLSEGLRALGAEAVEVPVLAIEPPQSFAALDAALRALNLYDWLIFTSTNTLTAFLQRGEILSLSIIEAVSRLRIACIGRATASAAEAAGMKIDLVPTSQVAEGLIDVLAMQVKGARILLPRAEQARDALPEALRAAGARVDIVEAYRNVLPAKAPEQLRRALATHFDAVTFTSSSSVTHLEEAAQRAGMQFPFDQVPAISIGPVTSDTMRACGWPPSMEAAQHDIPGLLDAVQRFFARQH